MIFDLGKNIVAYHRPSVGQERRVMNWSKGGTVIVRLPSDNGKTIELVGNIEEITLDDCRNNDLIYSIGEAAPVQVPSQHRTFFTIKGVALEQKVIDPPEDKIVRPTRWSDIMEEEF